MRGVFMKVEERVAEGHEGTKRDFKREWRVRSAKKQLVVRYGMSLIRWVIVYVVVVLLALVALTVSEVTGSTQIVVQFHASVASSIEAALVVIIGLVGTLAAIVPLFKLVFASNRANVSRGEVLFKEASVVKDQLGFLAKVKKELQELFDFLHDFDDQIVIVPIIDDLDRCITDGRNVKVLEAMQLILSVPGAPILSFLAVDSRIVVASIEEHYEKVFAKTNISGHEYLDKIVQVPFALPEPPPEKVARLLNRSLEGDAALPVQVAQRLKVFGKRGRQILAQVGGNKRVTFKVSQSRAALEAVVPLDPLVLAIERFWGYNTVQKLELDSEEQVLELVCAAARELGPYLKKLADQLIHRIDQDNLDQLTDKRRIIHKIYNADKEEAVEILCRETNAALEAGRLGFEEVAAAKEEMREAVAKAQTGTANAVRAKEDVIYCTGAKTRTAL